MNGAVMIVPFQPAHAVALNIGATFPHLDPLRLARDLSSPHAYTGMVDGLPVACAGVQEQWPGVGEAWVFLGPWVAAHPVIVARRLARGLCGAAGSFRRIQATVRADFARGRQLAEWLGMRPEGLMRGYGPEGADYIRYAWVRS